MEHHHRGILGHDRANAAGRPDRENHQCGFVDVTGRGYPEFTATVTRATSAMYPARASGERSIEKVLEQLVADPATDTKASEKE